jgi:hypothetical protein
MKSLVLAAALVLSVQARANIECAGRAEDKTFVRVEVTTVGANAKASEGRVTFERGGNTYGYKIAAADMSQFFEYDDAAKNTSVVGLTAFVGNESPVSIKYVGSNFIDMELKAVVEQGLADKIEDNFMRVWKGPGRASTDQYQLTKVACSVWY